MNIIIINSLYTPYHFGGAEVSVQLLAEGLAEAGNKVKIITLNDSCEILRRQVNGVDVVSIPLMNLYWPFSNLSQGKIKKIMWHLKDLNNKKMIALVKSELINFEPDVIHTNNLAGFSIGVWGVIKKLGYPLVHTTRDYYLFHPNSTLFKSGINISPDNFFVKVYSSYKKKMSCHIDIMVGISSYISNFHQQNGFARNASHQYIYNPVDIINTIKKMNNIIKVGFLGRLTSDKGFDTFIEYAKKYNNDMDFIAAGKTSSTQESKALLDDAHKAGIEIKGFVPVEEFLSDIDVLLLPTKWNEPFGRVVAEAALAKVPVFTNLTGGVNEIAGLFPWVTTLDNFDKKTINEMVVLSKTLENNSNPFEKKNMASRYYNVYIEAIKKRKIV